MLRTIKHATVARAFVLIIVTLLALCIMLTKASIPTAPEKNWAHNHAVWPSPSPAPTADTTFTTSLTPSLSTSPSTTASEPPPAASPKPPPTQFPTGLIYAILASIAGVAIIAITSTILGRKLPQAIIQRAMSLY